LEHTIYPSERPMRVHMHSLFLCPLCPIASLIGNVVGLFAPDGLGFKMGSPYKVAMRSGYNLVGGWFPLHGTSEPNQPRLFLIERIL